MQHLHRPSETASAEAVEAALPLSTVTGRDATATAIRGVLLVRTGVAVRACQQTRGSTYTRTLKSPQHRLDALKEHTRYSSIDAGVPTPTAPHRDSGWLLQSDRAGRPPTQARGMQQCIRTCRKLLVRFSCSSRPTELQTDRPCWCS